MNIILAFSIGLIFGAILIQIPKWASGNSNNLFCNSKYNKNKDSLNIKLSLPEYKVHKVEETYAKGGGGWIAKYTLHNFYVSGKSDVNLQELVLYDIIGKYNVGDILVLDKK